MAPYCLLGAARRGVGSLGYAGPFVTAKTVCPTNLTLAQSTAPQPRLSNIVR